MLQILSSLSQYKESMKKTKLMLQVEARAGKPLEEALPELINALGWLAATRQLGITRGAMSYWLTKFRIETKLIAIPPNYRLVLLPKDPSLRYVDLTEAA